MREQLFVWLGATPAAMALTTPLLAQQIPGLEGAGFPTDGSLLPAGVTRVWAAAEPGDADVLARALWVADGGPWRVLTPPRRIA